MARRSRGSLDSYGVNIGVVIMHSWLLVVSQLYKEENRSDFDISVTTRSHHYVVSTRRNAAYIGGVQVIWACGKKACAGDSRHPTVDMNRPSP